MRHTLITLVAFAAVVAGFTGVADALLPADPAPVVVLDTTEREFEPSPRAQVAAWQAAQATR